MSIRVPVEQLLDQLRTSSQGAVKQTGFVNQLQGLDQESLGRIFLEVVKYGYHNLVQLMVEDLGDNIEHLNQYMQTGLMIASQLSNTTSSLETVEALIKVGAELNLQDGSGSTALMLASQYSDDTSNLETVKALIKAGADLNLQNRDGETALMLASQYSNDTSSLETVEALIEAGADLNLQDQNGSTALLLASWQSNDTSSLETVEALIKVGADLNLQDDSGQTALMLASQYSNTTSSLETVKVLIKAGADLNLQDNSGETALMLASQQTNDTSSLETVKALIKAGADLNLQDRNGQTALMSASWQSNYTSSLETVEALIKAGADLNLQDQKGRTALDHAMDSDNPDVILLFLQPRLESGEVIPVAHDISVPTDPLFRELISSDQFGIFIQPIEKLIEAKDYLTSSQPPNLDKYFEIVPSRRWATRTFRGRQYLDFSKQRRDLERMTSTPTYGKQINYEVEQDPQERRAIHDLFYMADPDVELPNDITRDRFTDNFEIVEIYRLSNPYLTRQFRDRSRPSKNLRRLWHGSDEGNILSLLYHGYLIDRKLRHTRQLFGPGIYFAPLSYNSLMYSDGMGDRCLSGVDSEQRKLTTGWLLLNKVDLGRTYAAERPFELAGEGYDSLFADHRKPSLGLDMDEIVIMDVARILPTHLVKVACTSATLSP